MTRRRGRREEPDVYRIAVRPTASSPGMEVDHRDVDDVVVNRVELFRLEQMDRNVWFACCFLEGEPGENRIAFDVRYRPELDDVVVTVTEWPENVRYEDGAGPA